MELLPAFRGAPAQRARSRWAPVVCGCLTPLLLGASPAEPSGSAAAPTPPVESAAPAPPEARADPPWPELAAVFPGVLLHGSGTWLQGRTLTTQRLLLLEASALLAIAAGGMVAYTTGGARYWAGPTTFTIAVGAGTLSSSLLAQLYATWAPASGWGEPARLPQLVSALGYTYVGDPQFDDRHFASAELDGRIEAWHLALELLTSPAPGNQRIELLGGYRVFGPRAAAPATSDASYLEPQVGFSVHHFDNSGFVSHVLHFGVAGRLDAQRLLPDVRGAFFQAAAGLAWQWIVYDLPGVQATDTSSMLLVRMGFGMYLGGRTATSNDRGAAAPGGGELEFYYDHRRDGFAGGLKLTGPAGGFAGHVGLNGEYYLSESWGLRGSVQLGSNWVFGLSGLLRVGL